MSVKSWSSRNKLDLIVEVWEDLDCESVGARELEQIQQVLRERFGEGALESPAAIARTLADEGAVLRHPEVFECDVKWRERNLAVQSFAAELNFTGFAEAQKSFVKLDEQRQELEGRNDDKSLKRLRDIVAGARQDALLTARSKILDSSQREQAREISQWLTVWLQSPELFSDWLDLRLRSPEFRKKFGEGRRG
ncbi:MAG TPA: hypothetical protein DHU55_13015 [Blastocatellia bacterium]|jgi:hypothetical protein|nr:hypothetical protein [Blastocatellia bacterium]HAF23589.1 hypothetical protein [Blastocatellia bacterium]HCX30667.1 hypothetical protein [Blastocatellia bacterium]